MRSTRWRVRAPRLIAGLAVAATVAVGTACEPTTPPPTPTGPMRDVLLVGNSVAGTVSFIDAKTYRNLGSVNVIPDKDNRLFWININPITGIGYSVVKQKQALKIGEPAGAAGDRFVDDLALSPDGQTLYVSRSNLADVVALDLRTSAHPILWSFVVEGFKADHMTISPDGSKLVVSSTTADKAQIIDAKTGASISSFATGHYPHENVWSADGKRIYNTSIGDVDLPYAQNDQKGTRQLTIADGKTFAVLKTYQFPYGVRPSVMTADEKTMYAQLSYLNGLVQIDLTTGAIVKQVEQPKSAYATATYGNLDDYPHNSAHHGLALSGDGTKLCDAGTIDNEVGIVSTSTLGVVKRIGGMSMPYWSTTSNDGTRCFVSNSGDNTVAVVDYAAGAQVARIPVGRFPQRSRLARMPESELALLSTAVG